VLIDISTLTPGAELELVARLLNNDADDTSSVTVDFLLNAQQGLHPSTAGAAGVALAAAADDDIQADIDFARLVDVTSGFDLVYTTTAYDAQAQRLAAALDLTNAGAQGVRDDVLIAVRGVRDQMTGQDSRIQLAAFDGLLPRPVAGLSAGTPFIRLSSLLDQDASGFFLSGAAADNLLLTFEGVDAPGTGGRFDFDLVVLGQANAAPTFTSDPTATERGQAYPVTLADADGNPTRVLELVLNGNNNAFEYTPTIADPEDDAVSVSVLTGPEGLDFVDGVLTFTPQASADVGTHTVRLRATDEFGASDPANDQTIVLRVLENVANRPPRFTTDPVTAAEVGVPYIYDADAFDPDGDDLRFTGTATYTDAAGNLVTLNGADADGDGFAVDAATGEVTFTPGLEIIDRDLTVVLTVSDQQDPALTDTQSYVLAVSGDAGNRAPVIVSEPATSFSTATTPGTSVGPVSPDIIELTLEPGQSADEQVLFTVPDAGIDATADIVFVVDESGSVNEAQEFIRELVLQLDQGLNNAGITANRYALVGFGSGSDGGAPRDFAANFPYRLRIFGPDNQEVFNERIEGQSDLADLRLPTNGQYTVIIDREGQGPISTTTTAQRQLIDPTQIAGVNRASTGTLPPGAETEIRFTAPAGRVVFADFGINHDSRIRVELISPAGLAVTTTSSSSRDTAVQTLTESGEYRLVLSNPTADQATFDITPVDLITAATPLTSDAASPPVSGTVAAGASVVYAIEGRIGESLLFDGLASSSDARASLIRPDGEVIASGIRLDTDRFPLVLDRLAPGTTSHSVATPAARSKHSCYPGAPATGH